MLVGRGECVVPSSRAVAYTPHPKCVVHLPAYTERRPPLTSNLQRQRLRACHNVAMIARSDHD